MSSKILIIIFLLCDLRVGLAESQTNTVSDKVLFEFFHTLGFGTAEQVKASLDREPTLANAQYLNTRALNRAIDLKRKDIINVLLQRGADVEGFDPIYGYPVTVAAGSGNLDLLKELTVKGARLNVTNHVGFMPIHEAAKSGRTPVVEWLIEKGSPIDPIGSKRMDTPLLLAAMNGNDEAVKLLLDHGANINHQDNNGLTPLHWAVFHGTTNTVEILIERGADLNAKSNHGIRTYFGLRPLGIAVKEEDKPMVELLQRHGAKK